MEPPSPDGKGIWLDIQTNFSSFCEEALDKQKDVIWTFNGDEKLGMMSVMSVCKEKYNTFYFYSLKYI